MWKAKIFQIYYNAQTRQNVDPDLLGLDNLTNERPDWYEFWPIRRYLLTEKLDENTFYGFVSPSFTAKTGLTGRQLHAFLAEAVNREPDVILFSRCAPGDDMFQNVLEQGEHHHPGLQDLGQRLFQECGLNPDWKRVVNSSENIVYSNFFAARPAFWREWLRIGERLFALCEGTSNANASNITQKLTSGTAYGSHFAPMKVFLMERIASILLSVQPWKTIAYNHYLMLRMKSFPVSRQKDFILTALFDAAKRAYGQTGCDYYLEAYLALRRQFKITKP